MLVGVTLMVGSFRRTVDTWVASTVRADAYVTGASRRRGDAEATLSPALVAALGARPGLRAMDRLRGLDLDADGRRISLIGVDMGLEGGEERFALRRGSPAAALRAARDGGVLVGEPLARQLGLAAGDRLSLPGPRGPVDLRVAGVYYDYSAGAGSAAIDLVTMERLFGPGPIQSVALYLQPGKDAEREVEAIKAAFPGAPLSVRSNRRLREDVMAVFDQTFAVTRLLQAMGLLVAVCGITMTLLVLARQQVSELALYRALGARRRQIFRFYVGKGLGMALLGLGLGLGAGILLALVLTFVINRDYFGWTIRFHWPWGALAAQAATILVAAVLASLYPALRASRTPATELSREEVA
jgi:putative ABC transport system permease protein